jgi:class 3 adenylate cyclase/tetratricopeptide (TPR) repeat protein
MRCPRCHHETAPDAEFCSECGTKLAVICFRCRTSNALAHKFCKECGQRLIAATPGPLPKYQSPESYTPKYLAERIRTSASLEDERKQVTVLFADIKSSLELIADRDPEDASRILDRILKLMIEAIHRYDGTVNRVLGDGIMALFGAPVALEDHAARACYAALLMQETVKRFSEETRRTEGFSIQVRIGVNSGSVVVRSIRSDLQMDYAAVGETTHLAARMEQIATPGSILITGSVMRLAEGYIDVKSLGRVPIKGLRTPIEAFELIGAGPIRSRLQAAAARGFSRFVGRAAELKALGEALRRADAGHGQVVAVSGEAGVGKSRLLYEFVHSGNASGWLVLESNSASYGRTVPYFPITELLKNYFKIDGRDDPQTIRAKVTSKILMLDQSLQETIAPLLYVLEVLPHDHAFHSLEPTERREHAAQAIKRLVRAESRLQPVLVLFEDLQSSDSATLGVLGGLVDDLRDSRVLLLVSYRPEHQDDWRSRPYYRQLRLDPLPRESVDELLHALLGSDPSLTALKELLIDRTEGNPFFVEEIVRTLVETQVLGGERGRRYLAKSISNVEVPPLVQDVIASRLDRLPPQAIRLIREASVIGKDVSFKLLHMIADLPEAELRGHLANLQAAEFLFETQLFPDLEYTFKHALTHQVAYAGLLHDTRREIHARVLECIEKLHSDRLTEQVERLAHHALRGEVWPKALTYLRQAGAKAVDRPANREAVALFEQALGVLKHLPENRDTLAHAIDVRFDIRNALQPLGDLGKILEYLQEAEILAARINDQRRLGWVASYLTEHFRMVGNPESAAEAGERALTIARQLADLPLRVVTSLPMGLLYHATGEYRRAIEVFQWIVDHVKGAFFHERFGLFGLPAIHSRSFLAWCLAEIGEFAQGRMFGEEAVRFADTADQPSSMMYAYLGIGVLHLRSGDLQRAISAFERALELGEFAQIPVGFSYGASYLGYALALVGRTAEGVPLLEQSTSPAIAKAFVARHSLRVAYLGEGYLLSGRVDAAAAAATHALELARNHKERGHEAYALRLLGEVMTQCNEPAQAETHYRDAVGLAQKLGMRPLAAHCHWGLARLFRRAQNQSAEQQHVTAARAHFRDMEMVGWLQRMETEFAEPAGPLHSYRDMI